MPAERAYKKSRIILERGVGKAQLRNGHIFRIFSFKKPKGPWIVFFALILFSSQVLIMIPAQRAEAALIEIEVYVIQGHEVDVIQFIVSPPDNPAPPGCSDFHIHSADFVGVTALDTTFLPEPGPPCGYGIESTIELRTVTICEDDVDCVEDDGNICTVNACVFSKCANIPGNMDVVCRAKVDVCDVDDKCDGISDVCPSDEKESDTTVCRMKVDVCDKDDKCDGTNDACPMQDDKEPNTTVCRPKADVCDKDDKCDGTNDACPMQDDKEPNTTVCRPKAGVCDKDDKCDGMNNACPMDVKQPNTFECRAANGLCDIKDNCDGTTNACPADVVKAAGVVCRPAFDLCDAVEKCDGNLPTCPADADILCIDGDSCTNDFCDPASGCFSIPIPDGGVCDITGVCNMGICYESCPVPTTDPYIPPTCIVATDLVAPGDVIINPGVEFVIPGGNSFTFDCNDSFLIKAGATVWIKFLGALLCLI